MTPTELQVRADGVLAELEGVIVGKRDALHLLLAAILADGHVLIEDVPGLAKTAIARAMAQVLGLPFKRVQFTPDLLPADLTGSFIFNQRSISFEFRRGPIFTQVLLADEINRAAPKMQSALLEAMQEHQVTVEGETFALSRPFLVIATQNPIELEGTFPLPEAQLDRFLIRLDLGYPTEADEQEILRRRRVARADAVDLDKLLNAEALREMQAVLEDVFVEPSIERYIVALVRATRGDPRVSLGGSPRATLALMKLSRALAALSGRSFITPDDIKAAAVPVLAHRLILRPEHWGSRITAGGVVRELLDRVATPSVEVS
jgi:MoxR-like ATPase